MKNLNHDSLVDMLNEKTVNMLNLETKAKMAQKSLNELQIDLELARGECNINIIQQKQMMARLNSCLHHQEFLPENFFEIQKEILEPQLQLSRIQTKCEVLYNSLGHQINYAQSYQLPLRTLYEAKIGMAELNWNMRLLIDQVRLDKIDPSLVENWSFVAADVEKR